MAFIPNRVKLFRLKNSAVAQQQPKEGGHISPESGLYLEGDSMADDGTLAHKIETHVAEIKHYGESIILPMDMSIDTAIAILIRRKKFLEETFVFSETFDAFPFDGANAVYEVLTAKYGWATAEPTPGMWGPNPPQMMSIKVGVNKVAQIPWGGFSIPGVDGLIQTGVQKKNGRFCFTLSAEVKRKSERIVKELFAEVRGYLKTNSIYRGHAVKIRFNDDNGGPLAMPDPEFLDTAVDRKSLIYSQTVEDLIDINLFTPIERVRDLLANDLPVKRGILLGGKFGTGKTLAAKVAADLAVKNGITYIYVPRADELREAIEFGRQYQSPACVIFCEDIDRVMAGERSVEMDDILNIIDGIDSKSSNIIVVLTTNDLDSVNPAMLRPGRLDAVIEVTAPDGPAVERLVRYYGGAALQEGIDLVEVGEALDGQIPAIIAEVVKRAKLAQLRLEPPGTRVSKIGSAALLASAKGMAMQMGLLSRPQESDPDGEFITGLKRLVREGVNEE